MGKKHKFWRPQVRRRQKTTIGKLKFVDVIYLEKEKGPDGEENMVAVCSCGRWRSSEEATTFAKIGFEAKIHVEETGHQLRQH